MKKLETIYEKYKSPYHEGTSLNAFLFISATSFLFVSFVMPSGIWSDVPALASICLTILWIYNLFSPDVSS